jgi:Tfp pilus assembly protein PilO
MAAKKQQFKIDKRNAPYLVMVLGALYGLYLYNDFTSEMVPKMDAERTARATMLTKKQTELKRLREFVQNIEVIKLKLRELNLQLETALETMPKNYNLSALLRRLAILATNSGVELQSFLPGGGSERPAGAFYETLDVSLTMSGSFSETLVFLDQISRLKRLMKIQSLIFVSTSREPLKGPEGLQPVKNKIESRIRLFRFYE